MEKDPFKRFGEVYARARESGLRLPDAVSLATVGDDGQPSLRMVLLKGFDDRGFVFYTNLKSRKGRELESNPSAALCFWWEPLDEQVRIEGKVEAVSSEEADAYFATRDRGSQLGAWASQQSRPLGSRTELINAVDEVTRMFSDREVPRPGPLDLASAAPRPSG